MYRVLYLILLMSEFSSAVSYDEKSLEELVEESDHIVVGHVLEVDMIDPKGDPVNDPRAKTGPGSLLKIRFHIETEEVLYSKHQKFPAKIVVPDPGLIWTFGSVKEYYQHKSFIFLLRGDKYFPVYPIKYERPLKEKAVIMQLLERSPNKNSQQDAANDAAPLL